MIIRDLYGFLFPSTCLSCKISLSADKLPVCSACLQRFEAADQDELEGRLEHLDIGASGIFCLWNYHTVVASDLHKLLKYKGKYSYGAELGRLMAEGLRCRDDLQSDVIVPMPLSKARFLERGYNQAEELCKGLSDGLDIPVDVDLLKKSRETRRQTGLKVDERLANTSGAFMVSSHLLEAKPRILLVDDVVTTGASMAAAYQALEARGYPRISLAALCFADHW